MSRLLEKYNRWKSASTGPGTPVDELQMRRPPGTERQFRFLDSLSVIVSKRLRGSIDSLPTLESVGFDWSDRAGARPESLVVAFNIHVRYRCRNPGGFSEGRTVLPSRTEAEADLLEVASQIAPRLNALYPEIEYYRFDQVFEVTPTLTLTVPRAAAATYGTEVKKYSTNAVRGLTSVDGAPPSLRLDANRQLVDEGGWK